MHAQHIPMQKPIFMNRRSFSRIKKTVLCRRKSIEIMHIMNKLHEVSVSSDQCMCTVTVGCMHVHKYENVEIVLVDLWLRLEITQATRTTMKTKRTACNERNNKYNRKWSEMHQMYAFQEAWMQFKCDYIKHVLLLAYLQKLYARTPSHQHCVYWMHALDHE